MAEATLATTHLFKMFGFHHAEALSRVPAWLRMIRAEDLEFLAGLAPLSVRDEEWKYTPLMSLWGKAFTPVMKIDGILPQEFKSKIITGAFNILVCNGHYTGITYGDNPAGLEVSSGDEAFAALAAEKDHFVSLTVNDSPLFTKLNRAFFLSPLFLRAKKDCAVKVPVHLIHVITQDQSAVFPRVFIKAEARSSLDVLETVVAVAGLDYMNNSVMDIVLEEGARVEHVQSNHHSDRATHVGILRAWLAKDSCLRTFLATPGAGVFRNNASVMLEGEGSTAYVNGLHLLEREAHADSHTLIEHIAPSAQSNQLYKCVLDGEAHSVFNGKVIVQREAQKTNSYQLNKNLLLSRECRVDTKPQLEIMADDVKCTHGATIGQLDKDQLFYLQTRALSRDESTRILVRGFVDDVLALIVHPLLRQHAL
jgi:Fe-S cluster assembly protein SufD